MADFRYSLRGLLLFVAFVAVLCSVVRWIGPDLALRLIDVAVSAAFVLLLWLVAARTSLTRFVAYCLFGRRR